MKNVKKLKVIDYLDEGDDAKVLFIDEDENYYSITYEELTGEKFHAMVRKEQLIIEVEEGIEESIKESLKNEKK